MHERARSLLSQCELGDPDARKQLQEVSMHVCGDLRDIQLFAMSGEVRQSHLTSFNEALKSGEYQPLILLMAAAIRKRSMPRWSIIRRDVFRTRASDLLVHMSEVRAVIADLRDYTPGLEAGSHEVTRGGEARGQSTVRRPTLLDVIGADSADICIRLRDEIRRELKEDEFVRLCSKADSHGYVAYFPETEKVAFHHPATMFQAVNRLMTRTGGLSLDQSVGTFGHGKEKVAIRIGDGMPGPDARPMCEAPIPGIKAGDAALRTKRDRPTIAGGGRSRRGPSSRDARTIQPPAHETPRRPAWK